MGSLAAVLAVVACAPTERDAGVSREAALRQATITLVPERCAGVVVEDGWHALTAAHCVDSAQVEVRLSNEDVVAAEVVSLDRDQDLAVLRFAEPVPVTPLAVATELPRAGASVFFAGRPGRGGALQHAEIERLGRCPSLPSVPDALFTTIEGAKGDSGAPVVDEDLQVVGLVHGGAACSIAAPTMGAVALLERDGLEAGRVQARRGPRPQPAAPPRPRAR